MLIFLINKKSYRNQIFIKDKKNNNLIINKYIIKLKLIYICNFKIIKQKTKKNTKQKKILEKFKYYTMN